MKEICESILDLLPATVTPKYVGEMPSLSTEGVAVSEAGVNRSINHFNNYKTVNNKILRFFIRSTSYNFCTDVAAEIHKKLHKYRDEDFLGILDTGDLTYLGRNEQKMHEFQVNYTIMVEE